MSRSRLFAFRATTIASLMVAALAPATAARADTVAPHLTGFSRTSPATVGGGATISINFTATDDVGLNYVIFEFTDQNASTSHGAYFAAFGYNINGQTSASSTATGTLRQWAPSNPYQLMDVTVYDLNGNSATYNRDGTVTLSAGASGPTTHSFNLANADFTVNNPNEDITPPQITSLSVYQGTINAGDPIVVQYTATDDQSGIDSVNVTYTSDAGGSDVVASSPPGALAVAGPASGVVPLAAAGGNYRIFTVSVTDKEDNITTYQSDGTVSVIPSQLTPPPAPTWDWSSFDVTVNAQNTDLAAPLINSASRASATTVYLGHPVSVNYTASDVGTGVALFEAVWTDPRGGSFELDINKHCGVLTSGPATTYIPSWGTVGKYTLKYLKVTDRIGNQTFYWRNGSVQIFPSGATGPTTHNLNLAGLDFTFTNTLVDNGSSTPDTTRQYCPPTPDVSMTPSDTSVSPGDAVSLSGAVTRAAAAVPRPVLALYTWSGRTPHLSGLQRGSSSGKYSGTVSIGSRTTALMTRFLGADASNPADPGNSPSAGVHLVIPTHLSLTAAPVIVRYGNAVSLSARLARGDGSAIANARVLLFERPARATGYTLLGSAFTSPHGYVRFTETPVTNVRYLVRFDGSPTFNNSISVPVEVDVYPRVWRVLSSTSIPFGSSFTVSGGVVPSRTWQTIYLQQLISGVWQNVASHALSSSGGFSFSVHPSTHGTNTYRLYKPADSYWASVATTTFSVSVS